LIDERLVKPILPPTTATVVSETVQEEIIHINTIMPPKPKRQLVHMMGESSSFSSLFARPRNISLIDIELAEDVIGKKECGRIG
jgi:hypothetical protein